MFANTYYDTLIDCAMSIYVSFLLEIVIHLFNCNLVTVIIYNLSFNSLSMAFLSAGCIYAQAHFYKHCLKMISVQVNF